MSLGRIVELSIPALRGNPFDSRPIEGMRVSEIVGRDKILSSWKELIRSGSPRMVFLVGERGSGRTSLINALCTFSPHNLVCQYWPEEKQLLSVIHEISVAFDGFETSSSIHRISESLVRNLESKSGPLSTIALDYPSNVSMDDFLPRISPILQRLRALVIVSLTPTQFNSLDEDTVDLFDHPAHLTGLSKDEIQKLTDKRVIKMGKERWLLNSNILQLIYDKTSGNPRSVVNILQNLVDEYRGVGAHGSLDGLLGWQEDAMNSNIVSQKIEPKIMPNYHNRPNNDLEPEEEVPATTSNMPATTKKDSPVSDSMIGKNDDFTLIDWDDNYQENINYDEIKEHKEINNDIDDEEVKNQIDTITSTNVETNDWKNPSEVENKSKSFTDMIRPSEISNFGAILSRSKKTTESIESTKESYFVPDVYIDDSLNKENFTDDFNQLKPNRVIPNDENKANIIQDSGEKIVTSADGAVWTVDSHSQSTLPPVSDIINEPIYEEPIYEEPIYENQLIKKVREIIPHHQIDSSAPVSKINLGPKWEKDREFNQNYASELSDTELLVISKAKQREISPSDSELQALLQVGRPRLSQIYNGLNKVGILSVRKKGRSRMFKLSDSAGLYF